MASHFEKVLTDGWLGIYEEEYELTSASFSGFDGPFWRISKYSLKGGKQHGVDVVEIDNGHMTVVIVPTRGMGILEAFTDEVNLRWESPVRGLVHPAYVDEEAGGGLGWLEGFNELVCRCGLSYHGAPGKDVIRTNTGAETTVTLPLHGTIANSPAMRVLLRVQLQQPQELSVVGVVYDTRMFGAAWRLTSVVSTRPGSSHFTVRDTVENLSAMPSELELLYHCNYGPPLLGEGARLVAPIAFVCPRDRRAQEDIATWDTFGPPQPGYAEQVHFFRLKGDQKDRTMVALIDPDQKLAATIGFSVKQLPAFTLWKNTAAQQDGYVTGLEPGTDYPNSRFFERQNGRVIEVPAAGSYHTDLSFGLLKGAAEVSRVTEQVTALAAGEEATVCTEPDPEYCPSE